MAESLRSRPDRQVGRQHSNDTVDERTATPHDDAGVVVHHEHAGPPKEDPLRKDPSYVAYEKAGIENGEAEFDEDTDAIARAINSVVPQDDNPAEFVTTFRSIFLGTVFGLVLCIVNGIMAFRPAAVIIPPTIATLLSYPCGVFMAKVLPRGFLNPGPFTMKEHVIITMIASAAGGGVGSGIPYGVDNLVAQKWKGGQDISWIGAFGWVICTQMLGFGFAGMLRRFVVWPREMVWPGNFSQLALFASYHKKDAELVGEATNAATWKLSRYHFFWICVVGMFIWELLPLYFMTALQAISIGCWFSSNVKANTLLSATHGVGYTTLTFDWEYIQGTWLQTPFWVTATLLVGQVFWTWIMVPVVQYSSIVGGNIGELHDTDGIAEINTGALFNKDGLQVDKKRLYNADFTVNEDFVAANQPFAITSYFYLNYVMSFFNIAAVLSHIGLWYGPQIKRQLKALSRGEGREGNDLHNRLMRAYPEVPELVYAAIAVVFFVGMILVGLTTSFVMPVWSVFLATGIAIVFLIPIAIVQSITGIQIGLNVVTEFVIGLMIPGKVVSVMCFKSFGYNTMIQAMQLTSDLKLGHYLHIPPWHMLMSQIYGTLLQSVFATSTALWILENWKDRIGKGQWAANSYNLFFNAGAIWGAIGPAAFFSGRFSGIYYAFLAGALCPIIPWILNKKFPSRWWIYCNFPILTASIGNWGANLPNNYMWTTFFVSFFFQFYLYRNKFSWWSKYNYVTSAGFDCGLAICLVFTAFFGPAYPFKFWVGNPDVNNNFSTDWYCDDKTEYGQNPA
ncbi:OPT oligopeptide transporter protein-domain-containing protein [Geranomyces variabilis]|nr:OPT oligopeptide transporter protein-domain-containing protein [Geranomyces variabilis]KAJ3134135.1 hypothetical protein HDU90_005231 [Geranomyces variabilis]